MAAYFKVWGHEYLTLDCILREIIHHNSDKGAVIGAFGCPGGSGEYLQMPGHLWEHLFKLEKLGVESNHIVYGMFSWFQFT